MLLFAPSAELLKIGDIASIHNDYGCQVVLECKLFCSYFVSQDELINKLEDKQRSCI